MRSNDLRRLNPSRLPVQLPINETATAVLTAKVFEFGETWMILTAIIMTTVWIIKISQMVVERWIDPFDLER